MNNRNRKESTNGNEDSTFREKRKRVKKETERGVCCFAEICRLT